MYPHCNILALEFLSPCIFLGLDSTKTSIKAVRVQSFWDGGNTLLYILKYCTKYWYCTKYEVLFLQIVSYILIPSKVRTYHACINGMKHETDSYRYVGKTEKEQKNIIPIARMTENRIIQYGTVRYRRGYDSIQTPASTVRTNE